MELRKQNNLGSGSMSSSIKKKDSLPNSLQNTALKLKTEEPQSQQASIATPSSNELPIER